MSMRKRPRPPGYRDFANREGSVPCCECQHSKPPHREGARWRCEVKFPPRAVGQWKTCKRGE